jgi:hypothetical protein
MATTRYSLSPSQATYLTATSVGAATVSSPIEVTIDWPGLLALTNMSQAQARMQVLNVLTQICEAIETGNHAVLPG